MEYEELSSAEKQQILKNRLRQYEQEHFNNSLNLEALESSPDRNEDAIRATQETVQRLEGVIVLHRAKLDALGNTLESVPMNGGRQAPRAARRKSR